MDFGHYFFFFYPIKSCRNNYKKIPIKSCRISIKILNMIFPLNRVVIILKNPNKTCRIEKKFPNISSKNFFLTPIKSCRAAFCNFIVVLWFVRFRNLLFLGLLVLLVKLFLQMLILVLLGLLRFLLTISLIDIHVFLDC